MEIILSLIAVNLVVGFVCYRLGRKTGANAVDNAHVIKMIKDSERALKGLEGYGDNMAAILKSVSELTEKVATNNKNISITAKNNKVFYENVRTGLISLLDGQQFQNYHLSEILELLFPETVATGHILEAVDKSMYNVVYGKEGVERSTKAAREYVQGVFEQASKHAGFDTKPQYNIKNLLED